MPSIKKASDLYDKPEKGHPYQDATTIIELVRDALPEGETIADPAAEEEGDPEVIAYVNHGRWIGDCGLWDSRGWTCRNAQAVDPEDPRFFCIECQNEAVGGRWRPVTWPADVAAVETPLEALPVTEQNWTP